MSPIMSTHIHTNHRLTPQPHSLHPVNILSAVIRILLLYKLYYKCSSEVRTRQLNWVERMNITMTCTYLLYYSKASFSLSSSLIIQRVRPVQSVSSIHEYLAHYYKLLLSRLGSPPISATQWLYLFSTHLSFIRIWRSESKENEIKGFVKHREIEYTKSWKFLSLFIVCQTRAGRYYFNPKRLLTCHVSKQLYLFVVFI